MRWRTGTGKSLPDPNPDALNATAPREGHTGAAQVALAEATKDSDLALETRTLADQPLIEDAMRAAGFHLDPQARQPGAWLNDRGIPWI
jgi:hypothetical protein